MQKEEDTLQLVTRQLRKLRKKIPLDLGNYPYVCARLKAKKALLYPADQYQKFLQMEVPQISRMLGEGEYRDEIIALGTKYSGVNLIEMATRDNLAKTYTKILDFSEGELKNIVSKFIDRWDVFNIETILRGKFYGAEPFEILEDIVPAGTFTLEFLRKLVEKETIDDVIDALRGNLYYDTLIGARAEHEKIGTTAPFEDALIHRYYSLLLDTIHPSNEPNTHFLRFIRMEIDIINLRTLLRLNLGKAEIDQEAFIKGGHTLKVNELKEMLKLDWDALVSRLRKYSFYETIGTALDKAKEKGLNEVMRALEKYTLKEATRYANLHPLSILPVLDYMLAKKNEVENIRIVARGKECELDNDVIRRLLVL